ncbi:hypothetical protein NLO98_22095 [Pseudomonas syringae]|nr:hypothetical protein [Pseudomonas syringae]
MTIADHRVVEVLQELVNRGRLIGHQVRRVFLKGAKAGIVADLAGLMQVQSLLERVEAVLAPL